MIKLLLHFDGSFNIWNKSGKFGWVIDEVSTRNTFLSQGRGPVKANPITNNVCEWLALCKGLIWIKDNIETEFRLQIRGDSLLLINQLNKRWRCKKPHLKLYLVEAWSLLQGHSWQATWIPRLENIRADALTR